MIYFAPEAQDAYARIGLTHHRTGYFASRSAAMGAVRAEVVIATFFNFHPPLVERAMDGVWDVASPAQVLDARYEAADAALRRAFGEAIGSAELVELAGLARTAAHDRVRRSLRPPAVRRSCRVALARRAAPRALARADVAARVPRRRARRAPAGRRSFGGRGARRRTVRPATFPTFALQSSRAWSDDEWAAAVDRLQQRGDLDGDGQFTEAGRARRQRIEDQTDALAAPAYAALTDDDAEQLVQLGRRFSRMVIDAGLLPMGAATRTVDDAGR